MLEFSGKISNSCLKYILNRAKIFSFIASFIAAVVLIIPFIYLSIFDSTLYLIMVFILLLFPFLSFFAYGKHTHKLLVPKKIIIDSNTLETIGEKFHFVRNINDVKIVKDFGDWYHILFYFGSRCENFICQKNLLSQGTISEFEKLFKGKIIKKYKLK